MRWTPRRAVYGVLDKKAASEDGQETATRSVSHLAALAKPNIFPAAVDSGDPFVIRKVVKKKRYKKRTPQQSEAELRTGPRFELAASCTRPQRWPRRCRRITYAQYGVHHAPSSQQAAVAVLLISLFLSLWSRRC
ncbi:hypothetical protein HPB50_027436 [Hyalomma asiaticum]|uniref:Uncharacterized protein n=1 Tax=Hyalomma asiaticum TaxID=266040 RepID=A0ACB7SJB1_HYAAI|nr:hypothetical protein HPB50_027436 [Hyalomma asiaticum]